MRYSASIIIYWVALLLANPLLAEEDAKAQARGREIIVKMEEVNSGWRTSRADAALRIRTTSGRDYTRDMSLMVLEVLDDGDKSLAFFRSPMDIRGTAFLSYSHTQEADEQWMYMPALNRVKRIASSDKSKSFMGSEFSYEDMSSREVEEYRYLYRGEDNWKGAGTYIVRLFPNYPHSGYQYFDMWIDKDRYIPLKVEYYDTAGTLFKRQEFSGYQLYDKFWRCHGIVMENLQNGNVSSLSFSHYELKIDFPPDTFSVSGLKRLR